MSIELDKVTTQYRKFTNGQYIEYDQFNEFLNSFEDQDRLSRVLLRGVGIVCGFEISLLNNIINLTSGNAVTTDGDLFTLEATEFKYYRAYDDYKSNYSSFDNSIFEDNLYELLEKDDVNDDTIKPLGVSLENKSDLYAVLYLESYEKESRPCRGVDCDNYGVEQIKNLRVLLTDASGIEELAKSDSIYHNFESKDDSFYNTLEEIVIKRPVLTEETNTVDKIEVLYTSIVEDTVLHDKIVDNFERITASNYFTANNVFEDDIDLSTSITNLTTKYGCQYAYTFVRELISTYNEIKELVLEHQTLGFLDFKAFQKHIMLGKLSNTTFRHQFYKSPVIDENPVLDKIELLIKRFNAQVLNASKFESVLENVLVTPSSKNPKLGEKAIPFYYKEEDAISIRKYWDYSTSVNKNAENTLSYFHIKDDLPQHVQDPIKYNLDQASFFRIEGHQGQSYEEVKEFLDEYRFENQLDFDVVLVSLEKLDPNQGDETKANYLDYLEKHPGIAHQSGVYSGGTFVMFYESEANKTIFADFTLPYLCCPTKYDYALTLPIDMPMDMDTAVVCRENDSFIIVAEPLLATVIAFADGVQIDAIEKKAGQNYFNPASVPESSSVQEITFTVNERVVETILKVYPVPEVTITTLVTYPEDKKGKFYVTYGGLDPQYEYEFDFYGNDESWELITPDAATGNYEQEFDLDPNNLEFTTKVLAKNKIAGCLTSYELLIIAIADIEINSVTYEEDCCNGLEIKDFTYSEGAVFCIKGGETISVPFEITTVNSEPYTEVITQFKLITASNWSKEYTIKELNDLKTEEIAIIGTYDLQVKIGIDGVLTDWYTCPRFIIEDCIEDNLS